MPFCSIIVPGPWWNSLTYEAEDRLSPGIRVAVPVGRGERIGIVEKGECPAPAADGTYRIRRVGKVLDHVPFFPSRFWSLLEWAGRAFLCGTGEMVKIAAPAGILASPEPLPPSPSGDGDPDTPGYEENLLYECDGSKRLEKLLQLAEEDGKFLALFPEQGMARSFWEALPEETREKTLLWPATGGKRLASSWSSARLGEPLGVVGGPGAVFCPLPGIRRVIVDEESSGGYRSYVHPRVNCRTLAGKRARLEGASLTLSGRVPSSRVFLRGKPRFSGKPRREGLRFVDMRQGFSSEIPGVTGSLPLTEPLLRLTVECVRNGRVALWLLDRKGFAGEVACEDCGEALRCAECGSVMAWEEKRERLRCSACGRVRPLPEICPSCRGRLFLGKRPGLEALLPAARTLVPEGIPVLLWNEPGHGSRSSGASLSKSLARGGILLGTRACLAVCDMTHVGFAGWIDADAEVRNVAYQAKFTAFSMIWESVWRGSGWEDREVLLQSRRPLAGWQRGIALGWEYFWTEELEERRELGLPPFSFLLEVLAPSPAVKQELMGALERKGFLPMDPVDPPLAFWVSVSSVSMVYDVFAPFFSIGQSGRGFPEITVWID